ncbi:uncharacterized protein A1O5_10221 [Cladophialophora psammophila CBS 110553]|uniref:Arrestin-like N-terminal domain-containing protein n=1 Tax=Cladophialophora psammophila CBS 110553 TaxID=1182543 RepID=W9WEK3_9EURO|nr:uncharacterized protein A1O5_10221 [Cladophialophora psammophila CBS 110553]EXJ66552.1 hypothetical protein A1O5_10221 [Cladophialophora psammophila CBS 110553]
MSLSIQLPQTGPYHPGSHFSGTLFLTSARSIPIGSIVITFTGLSRVTLTQNYGDLSVSSTDYHSREVLFQREKVLYTGGKWTHSAGEYSWPFGFKVPEYADDRMMSRCLALQRTVQGIQKHDLPPTMLYSCRGFVCAVEYILEATLRPPLSSPMATIGKSIAAKSSINILPQNTARIGATQNPTSRVDQSYVRHHQVFKLPRGKTHVSLQNPMSRILKLSKLQRDGRKEGLAAAEPSLSISVLLPRRIENREDYSTMSILFSGQSLSNTKTCATTGIESLPPSAATSLTIKSMKIAIIQHTKVQAGHHPSTSTRKTYTRKTTCSLPLSISQCETFPSGTDGAGTMEISAYMEVDLAEVTQLRIPRESLVLDFATYNAAIEHTLNLEIGIEYEGREFKFACQDVPIRVVPASSMPEQSVVQAEYPRIQRQSEYGLARVGIGRLVAQSSNQQDQDDGSEAQAGGRGEGDWVIPPPEAGSIGGHSYSETDAFFSQPPPRYAPRT